MQVGDLVQNLHGEYGIITRQIGVIDRFWVEWLHGDSYGTMGYNLWVVSCK